MTTLAERAEYQAIYMQHLLDTAKSAAEKENNKLFDPQGRILVDVSFADENYQKIIQAINDKFRTNFSESREGLMEALGREISADTTVSLDLSDDLKSSFKNSLEKELRKLKPEGRNTTGNIYVKPYIQAYEKAVADKSAGSIIPLQQEFDFHLSLAARTYEKIPALQGKQKEIHDALRETQHAVNQLVIKEFAKALKKATKDNQLDISQLNQALDKARKTIMPKAHKTFQEKLASKGIKLKADDFKGIKHIAETTTASSNDVLHIDTLNGLATLITGNEVTAHNRGVGKIADRQLITHRFDKDKKEISINAPSRIQIRTPSLDVKKGLEDKEMIADVSDKLQTIAEKYQLSEVFPQEENGLPQAFIYNLYTSLNDRLGDMNGNLQTQGADFILQGMHQYNASQNAAAKPVYCFVQNIPVNGFGDTLSYKKSNVLVKEATLMTDMALMHTLSKVSDNQDDVKAVFQQYQKYLNSDPRPPAFFQTKEGQEAVKLIGEIKEAWKKAKPSENQEPFVQAQQALQKIIAHDLHHDSHEYAKLTQALAVYIEQASIGGCKSGNERAQAINGRVAILDTQNAEIFKEIKALAKADSKQVKEKTQALKLSLDEVYNRQGLQTAASMVSLLDQGASAKVEAKPGGIFISRNYAEESSLTNLQQSKAGKMQAHKSLTKEMQHAWGFGPKTFWQRMKSSPLGTYGAVLGTLFFPVAIGVAIYNAVDNSKREKLLKADISDTSNMQEHTDTQEIKSSSSLNGSFKHMVSTLGVQRAQTNPGEVPEMHREEDLNPSQQQKKATNITNSPSTQNLDDEKRNESSYSPMS